MMQMCTYYYENHVNRQSKTWDFAPNYVEEKTNLSVLMRNKQTSGSNIQIPEVLSTLM